MEKVDKDLDKKVEEAKYRLRIEITEQCLYKQASFDFIEEICLFNETEIKAIYNSLLRRNNLFSDSLKTPKYYKIQNKTDELDYLNRELKKIEKEYIVTHKNKRQKEADLYRKEAAENARLAVIKMKQHKTSGEQRVSENKSLGSEIIKNKKISVKLKNKLSPIEPSIELSKMQKQMASIGNCYLRGLSVEQAALFSKVQIGEVQKIYRSFKKKKDK